MLIGKISVYKQLRLLFKFANCRNKRRFVSTAIEAVIGILRTIGDINDIFPKCSLSGHIFVGTDCDTVFAFKSKCRTIRRNS